VHGDSPITINYGGNHTIHNHFGCCAGGHHSKRKYSDVNTCPPARHPDNVVYATDVRHASTSRAGRSIKINNCK